MPPSCKVVVTGGGGFLGRYLCQTLLRRKCINGRPIESIGILDAGADTHMECDTEVQVFPNGPTGDPHNSSVKLERYRGDITDKKLVGEILRPRVPGQEVAVFHLASIMSGQGESDFDKCLTVNLDGTRNLLEESRGLYLKGESGGQPVRFIFPSSFAAFGPIREVDDETKLAPQSTYGTTKALAELLVNDFTRKGYVDGRTGRLPTVIVRPGNVNGAATGCFSGIVREILMGNEFVIPIPPRQTHPVISTWRTIKCLLALAELPSAALGADRAVNLPALQTSIDELLFHTRQIAQGRGIPLGGVTMEVDPWTSRIVGAMPQIMHSSRARQLGLPQDTSVEEIVESYVDSHLGDEMSSEYPLLAT